MRSFYASSIPYSSSNEEYIYHEGNADADDDDGQSDASCRSTTSNSHGETPRPMLFTMDPKEIIVRIENVMMNALVDLSAGEEHPRLPQLIYCCSYEHTTSMKDLANISQSRSVCNIFLILKLVYGLLLHNSKITTATSHRGLYAHRYTITTRQAYYYHVTYFKNQNECDDTISDVCRLLRVPRIALCIVASPKGWLCGAIQIQFSSNVDSSATTDYQLASMTILDGITALKMGDGLPISSHWIDYLHTLASPDFGGLPLFVLRHHPIFGAAKMIVVIEKETVYHRLVEEISSNRSGTPNILHTCIFITGKGYPDVATRACLSSIAQSFPNLPVVGFCDCNPFGIHILHTFQTGGAADALNVEERTLLATPQLEWIGLYPSYLASLEEELPRSVFQQMTARDVSKLNSLLEIYAVEDEVADDDDDDDDDDEHCHDDTSRILQELNTMQQLGYKAELEALHWLGMDHLTDWFKDTLTEYLNEWERR